MRKTGYTSCCDWWSVGVIMYEMLVGQPPFYAPTPAETQYKVINWEKTLKIPPEVEVSQPAMDLILRLCCVFTGLRQQPAPYKPQIRHLLDTSNFDPVESDKVHNSDSVEDFNKMYDHPENGRHPEHAFFEFTFHRFFDYEPDPNGTPVYV
ncbi:hypothetical protein ScPMuIL_012424 [Solemya velum]